MEKGKLESLLKTPSGEKWKRLTTHKRAGVLVPLFSVYSKNSLGIGELADIRILIDWCRRTGNSILQLLPMNEVGSTFCPYDATSSFALESSYISLTEIAAAKKDAIAKKIKKAKKSFPAGKTRVNYKIKEEKISLLWDIYKEEGDKGGRSLKEFAEENSYWIRDFAVYKVLKRHAGGRPWYEWEEQYKNRDERRVEAFSKEHEDEIGFEIWAQLKLNEQFKEIKKYAGSKVVLLKGDLPILISRDSADVWVHPELFKLEYAAGAGPDMYCAKGQRWGMPTYNWEAIESGGYRYLKEKLRYAENFYDILRIDHVVGLFRIWSIPYNEPMENKGLNGFFDPGDENVWGDHGKNILSVMIKSTKMLLVAEDLGIIPKVCPETLKSAGIPGNDVQRWVKDWKVRHDFLDPKEYRAGSVAMLSTHDTTNWAAWWENEAGTVDEDLFMRKCADRGIDYGYVKGRLFDPLRSRHGRLKWSDGVTSAGTLIEILGKKKEELADFIDLYKNSYKEKEKLWDHLGLKGRMREAADEDIIEAVFKITLNASSVFCINLIVDLLYLGGIFKGDPYQYRINTPGTISKDNWSLVIPISLEDLMKHGVSKKIKRSAVSSGRAPNGR